MKGYSTKEILSPGFRMPDSYEELLLVYRTLAKSADQRLVRLEKYASEPNMKNATTYAYARAARDIESWSVVGSQARGKSINQEKPRFNTAAPLTKSGLLAKIRDIQTFLTAPTSTKAGIKKVYQKRADTINRKYGTNFTWQELGDFFESDFYNNMDSRYASNTILESVGEIQKHKEVVEKMLQEKNKPATDKKVIRIADDAILQKTVNEIIKKYPDDVRKLLR